jgi:alpha-L-fucosidase
MIDDQFGNNLARGAHAEASEYRGENSRYSPSATTDGDPQTYWATNDGTTRAHIDIDLGELQEIKYILIQEYIRLGQRVKEFKVDSWQNDAWKPLASATTIGYKRILKVDPVKTSKIRITITASRACPLINNVEVY